METSLLCQDEIEIVNYELLEASPIEPLSTNFHHHIQQYSGETIPDENLVLTEQSFITFPTTNASLNPNMDTIDTGFNTVNFDAQDNPGIRINGKLIINNKASIRLKIKIDYNKSI